MVITANAQALADAVWRKSSHSGSLSQCVEVADLTTASYEAVGVRDSKLLEGPVLIVARPVFARFVAVARESGFTAGP
jgi:hypothetical protein